jgi:hypothetical protein
MHNIIIMVELEVYNEWLVEHDIVQIDWKLQVINGNLFIKHHRWGKPKLRHVWVDKELNNIYWGDSNETEKSKIVKGSIPVKDLKEVKEGLVKSSISDKKATQRNRCTFTLISKSRTLELECPTQVMFL